MSTCRLPLPQTAAGADCRLPKDPEAQIICFLIIPNDSIESQSMYKYEYLQDNDHRLIPTDSNGSWLVAQNIQIGGTQAAGPKSISVSGPTRLSHYPI